MLLQGSDDRAELRASVGLRLRVWRQRPRLDAALANGAAPSDSPGLALRARQLRQESTRHAIARAIRNVLDAAEEPPEAWGRNGSSPPLQREALLAARHDLLSVADRLCRARNGPPQAIALAASLVWDSASPAYSPNTDATLEQWVDTVADLLVLRSG